MKKVKIIITIKVISDDYTIAEFKCLSFLKKIFTKKYPTERGYKTYEF